jgi:hypothetical protein
MLAHVSKYLAHCCVLRLLLACKQGSRALGPLSCHPARCRLLMLDQICYFMRLLACLVRTCNELNAGYAADGFCRRRGVGACVVTYGVGGLSAINACAGCYSEDLPVIFISGKN